MSGTKKSTLRALTDAEITELFIKRDETAIEAIAEKYGALYRRVALNILGNANDASECENDTYMRLWNSIPPNRPKSFTSYGVKVARNLALDMLERRSAEKRGGADPIMEELDECIPDTSGLDGQDEKDIRTAIDGFLRETDEENKAAFILRYFYAEPLKTIAKRLGCGIPKVKSILFRTREKLKKYLEKEGVSI